MKYFHNFIAKSDKKLKMKNGMNQTQIIYMRPIARHVTRPVAWISNHFWQSLIMRLIELFLFPNFYLQVFLPMESLYYYWWLILILWLWFHKMLALIFLKISKFFCHLDASWFLQLFGCFMNKELKPENWLFSFQLCFWHYLQFYMSWFSEW